MLLTSLLRMGLTRSFQPFRFKNLGPSPLKYKDLDNLGLYVHIPFCRTLCSFCPYCKVPYNFDTAVRYKKALLGEIELVGRSMKGKKTVTGLYFGGGTPALMAEDLGDIIKKLQEYFIITGGIGAELHPEDITPDNLRRLKESGITMVSLGIQSFDGECLARLGRQGDDFVPKLSLVKASGFETVDVDLIFAIPGQTEESLKKDIALAFEHGATQISTYPFIDFTFAKNPHKPLSQKKKKHLLKVLSEECRKHNRVRTSVWTFALPNTRKYSSVTREAFLGFGVSATTLLKDCFKINTFSIDAYCRRIEQELLPTSLTLSFTLRQRAVYYLFWSAYGLKLFPERFEAVIGKPVEKLFGAELWLLEKLGYIRREKNYYEMTEKAATYYHRIEQVYTTAYIDRMWRISRNTAFPDEIVLR